MKEVIGVRFRRNGKVYYFDPRDNEVELGTKVIVETQKGIEFGWVVIPRREIDDSRIQGGLRSIQRLATERDIERYESNKEKSKRAFHICEEKIKQRELDMKLISAEYAFDGNKISFYFTADGRVDFRELVKDLAYALKSRIELRQVGVRDEARICGGIGMCGRELCCHSYLPDFVAVSIKMAKEQGLSLNPTKISGVCGRLMCCLKHEEETYEYLNSLLPNVGDRVKVGNGVIGEVASVNVLRQRVKVVVTDEEGNKDLVEYKIDELQGGKRGRKFDADDSSIDPELSALEEPDYSAVSEEEEFDSELSADREMKPHGDRNRGPREDGEGRRNRPKKGEKSGERFGDRPRKDGQKDGQKDGARDGSKDPSKEAKKGGDRRKGNPDKAQDKGFGKTENRDGNRDGNRDKNREGGKPHGDNRGGKPKMNKGQKPEEQGKEKDGQKNFHRKNRPNNRPRESKKPGQNQ